MLGNQMSGLRRCVQGVFPNVSKSRVAFNVMDCLTLKKRAQHFSERQQLLSQRTLITAITPNIACKGIIHLSCRAVRAIEVMGYRVTVNAFRVPVIILGYIPICTVFFCSHSCIKCIFFGGGGMRRRVCRQVGRQVGRQVLSKYTRCIPEDRSVSFMVFISDRETPLKIQYADTLFYSKIARHSYINFATYTENLQFKFPLLHFWNF